jgi:hypothetical protein
MARGVNRVTRVTRGIGGGQGRRRISTSRGNGDIADRNRLRRSLTAEQQRGDFSNPIGRASLRRMTALRGRSDGSITRGITRGTGNAGGTGNAASTASTAARTGSSGGNAGGGSTSGDPHQNRGSRRAASATSPAPAVRPRPSEARAARGQLIRQIANRRQNARRSQRAA